ncbi:metal-dependent transcriptional regulator [Arcanobacterium phocisimile]|uniref:Manganese transport regulator n=1 Tax=Arcanobacterium phocisimile TaxID=1302235 RepID=A0ABX7IGQ6_9ACTO|nr:metal-dependent transcriptional regulator [Arcanobacterium phocisimile]QRV02313.1 metal-dependent transcriptional regulator [Arcanobacterium phocisimile]
MPVSSLSESTQNYMKAIWSLGEWSDEPVTASSLAARAGVKLSTASDAIRKLTDQGLVDHAPYGAVYLTDHGRSLAVAMVRRHRLIETFLVDILGYAWDEVHAEAEVLEHAVSDVMVARMAQRLGNPSRDPHGDPIPAADGTIIRPQAVLLSSIDDAGRFQVERISDGDPDLLRFFDIHGIAYGCVVETQPPAPYSESIEVTVKGHDSVLLGVAAQRAIWVSSAN